MPQCDDGTRAHESSFWDLLKPELQHSIIELALELRRSEAREKYQTIRSLDFGFRWVEDFALPLHWDNMVSELEELVQEIRAAEQCFGVECTGKRNGGTAGFFAKDSQPRAMGI